MAFYVKTERPGATASVAFTAVSEIVVINTLRANDSELSPQRIAKFFPVWYYVCVPIRWLVAPSG